MSFGLFEVLAHNDDEGRRSGRKAAALAKRRAELRFANFLKAASSKEELASRLALVEDDLDATIKEACEECGCEETDRIKQAVLKTFAGDDKPPWVAGDEDDGDPDEIEEDEEEGKTSSVKEARRPKMCPYHAEVTDISLAAGDPTAGFNAMSQHAWSQNHCQGDYDGKCNFKREMVTQEYWDHKQQKAEERRLEREQQRLEQPDIEAPETPEFEAPSLIDEGPEIEDSAFEFSDGTGVTDVSADMAEAPSAVGMGVEARSAADNAAPPCPKCQSHTTGVTSDDGTCNCHNCGNTWTPDGATKTAPVVAAAPEKTGDDWRCSVCGGTPRFDEDGPYCPDHPNAPGKTAAQKEHMKGVDSDKRQRQYEHIKEQCLRDGGSEEECKEMAARTVNKQRAEKGETKSNVHEAEALKTIDIERESGPVPKMDKRKWNNLEPVDSEMDGSPHPTRHQDIQQAPAYGEDYDDIRGQTDAVVEQQDADKNTAPKPKRDKSQWTQNNGTTPVTKETRRAALPPYGHGDHDAMFGNLPPGADPGAPPAGPGTPGFVEDDPYGAGAVCPNCGADNSAEYSRPANMDGSVTCRSCGQTHGGDTEERYAAKNDPDKNPLRELIETEYEGFVPQGEVQQAVSSYEKRANVKAPVGQAQLHNGPMFELQKLNQKFPGLALNGEQLGDSFEDHSLYAFHPSRQGQEPLNDVHVTHAHPVFGDILSELAADIIDSGSAAGQRGGPSSFQQGAGIYKDQIKQRMQEAKQQAPQQAPAPAPVPAQ